MERQRLREALVGLITALASALASIFVFTRAVEKKPETPPPEPAAQADGKAVSPPTAAQRQDEEPGGTSYKWPRERQAQAHPAPAQEHKPEPKPVPPGWGVPEPQHIPRPTYWPVTMALAITFIFWGFVTSLVVTGVGVTLFVVALAGWLGDIKNEHEETGH